MPSIVTLCGVEYGVTFARTPPTLTLTPITASGGAVKGGLDCCGCGYAIFSFGGLPICTDDRVAGGPCNNLLRLKIEYSCCPIAGWEGDGWYCVKAAGGSDSGCYAAEVLDADKCDTSIAICSGPYASEAAALAVCNATTSFAESCPDPAAPVVALGETMVSPPGTRVLPTFWRMPVTGGTLYHVSWGNIAPLHGGVSGIIAGNLYSSDCVTTFVEGEFAQTIGTVPASGCIEFTPSVDGCLCLAITDHVGTGIIMTINTGPCP